MSLKSSRRLKKKIDDINSNMGSTSDLELETVLPNCNKKKTKIRQTNELFYFNSDSEENEENSHLVPKHIIKKNLLTDSCKNKTRRLRNIEKINEPLCLNYDSEKEEKENLVNMGNMEANGKNHSLTSEKNNQEEPTHEETAFIRKSRNSFELRASVTPAPAVTQDRRKIVKAKRLLKNNNLSTNSKLEKESPKNQNYVTTQPCDEIQNKSRIKDKSFQLTHLGEDDIASNKSGIEACGLETKNSILAISGLPSEVQLDISSDQRNNLTFSNEESFVIESVPQKSQTNLIVTMVLSPISPSTGAPKNFEDSPVSHFESSEENLRPSKNGTVDTSSKRRTYELENSVIDLSLLKSASEKDSSCLSTEKSSLESNAPSTLTFSKVTKRRKWNKDDSCFMDGSPFCVNSCPQTPESKTKTGPFKPSTGKKHLSKVKVPNFAEIHKRALDKVESISEYKKRKENRAKMLLSGQKPSSQMPASNNKEKKDGRKQLRFAAGTLDEGKSPTFIPLPSTPLPKKVFDDSGTDTPPILRFRKVLQQNKNPFNFLQHKENSMKKDQVKENKNPFNFLRHMQDSGIQKVVQINKQNITSKIARHIKTTEKIVPTPKNKNVNGFDFNFKNLAVKSVQRIEEIKSIVTKKTTIKNTLEARKCAIKGVRSNRRFELLMNMRKGK